MDNSFFLEEAASVLPAIEMQACVDFNEKGRTVTEEPTLLKVGGRFFWV